MTTEIWKSITGYDGIYEVSNLGRIKRLERRIFSSGSKRQFYQWRKEKILKPHNVKNNYMVQLTDENKQAKWYSISRLVALEFIANPDNLPNACHKDGNSLNNNADNLFWGTDLEAQRVKQKPIRCIETNKVYDNATIIEKELGYKASLIYQICKGRYSQAYGYHWEYAERG